MRTCSSVVTSFLAKSTHELPLSRGCLVTLDRSRRTFSASSWLWTKWKGAYSILVFVWTKWSYLLVQVPLTSIAEPARRNDSWQFIFAWGPWFTQKIYLYYVNWLIFIAMTCIIHYFPFTSQLHSCYISL